ncbi:MAG: RNA-binding S4 domain-containing protein [Oscillospiraceae bacterium]|nr:RNA-binding S4 domain-containing protein [Oscillospiraceae bacterium]
MRLDKYLKVTRLIKRRTVANEACDAGRVTLNGKVARASAEVKAGDEIGITLGTKTVTVRVLSVNEYANKENAADQYTVIGQTDASLSDGTGV